MSNKGHIYYRNGQEFYSQIRNPKWNVQKSQISIHNTISLTQHKTFTDQASTIFLYDSQIKKTKTSSQLQENLHNDPHPKTPALAA